MSVDDEYTYEILDNENDARICAQLIADEFSTRNPMTTFNDISSTEYFEGNSWPLMEEILKARLSFIARHRASGEIIGVVTAEDLYSLKRKYFYDPSAPPASHPSRDFTWEINDNFIRRVFGPTLMPNMVLRILLGATKQEHENKGVATRLRETLWNYARDSRGFQYAFVQASHSATRHIYLTKFGGEEMFVIDPATWVWKKKDDGVSRPFKDYKGPPISQILLRKLSN